jgi:hypothetical protein
MAPKRNSFLRSNRSLLSWSIILLLVFVVLSSQAISCDWSGEWAIKWGLWEGKLHNNQSTLTQTGNKVTGTYNWHGGQIDGEVVGNKLIGKWTETDNNGRFEFTMESDCKSFEGVWGYANSIGDGYWDGYR